jgi:signal transduction histidine kinase
MHAAEGTLMLQGSVAGGHFSDAGWPDDPSAFQRPFDMAPALRLKLMAHDRLQWHPVGASAQAEDLVPEMTPWCRAAHFRAQALHALMAGERLVGVVFMMFADDTPLSAQQQEVTQALCQPLTLALELTRLAQQVQRAGENAAVLSERNRLAREIHDGIAQSFLAIQMQLDLLKQAGAVSRPVALARELAGHGLTEARRAVAALRPHGLVGRDLPDALESLAHQLMAGATLRLSMERPPAWEPLPMRVEDHLYRMVQEALNNVVKHAGARHVRIELSQSLAEINVLIADDGVGFDPKQASAGSGFGLEGLEQRAQAIGARMHWLTRPGHGCQVLITLRREGLAPDGERAS